MWFVHVEVTTGSSQYDSDYSRLSRFSLNSQRDDRLSSTDSPTEKRSTRNTIIFVTRTTFYNIIILRLKMFSDNIMYDFEHECILSLHFFTRTKY